MPFEQTDRIFKISLPSAPSTTVSIYYYGATVSSWTVNGKEQLFLSEKSVLDGSKAIRGGIPICWPIFGAPPSAEQDESLQAHSKLNQHGFARNQIWKFDKILLDRDEGVSVRFTLDPTAETNKIFPSPFHLSYVVTLSAHELSTDLHVENPSSNPGGKELKFQALLHSYLRVEDASKIKVKGLKKGLTYIDKVKGQTKETWEGGDLKIEQEVDRVYQDVGLDDLILDKGTGESTIVHRRAFPDCVVWNPQVTTGSKMVDMQKGGWNHYVCIEPGYVKTFKTLAPGEKWIGQQVLKVRQQDQL